MGVLGSSIKRRERPFTALVYSATAPRYTRNGNLWWAEDRPGSHRKGMGAGPAAPLPATGQEPVTLHDPAFRADHLLALSPTQFPESMECLLVTELEDFPHR